MSKKKECCPTCGQAVMKYRHTITRGLAALLIKIARHTALTDRPFHAGDVFERYSDRSNFQHLKYWDLIDKYYEGGFHVHGMWRLTNFGIHFVQGNATAHRTVTVFNNNVVEHSDEVIGIGEADPGWYQTRNEWSAQAQPAKVMDNGQRILL